MTQPIDSAHISQRLETGRRYLEVLADIASQLEHAKEGLLRSSHLETNLDDLPPTVRRIWESLDKDIAVLPRREFITELLQLEKFLTERLTNVMPQVENLCAAAERGEAIQMEGFRWQLAELFRLASTTLAMRLLAHRKNYAVPPARLPIKANLLRERAQQVKAVERKHKLRVITQMKDMVNDTTAMLNNPKLDPAMRSVLKGVLRDLQTNARHLATGGTFNTLPVPFEHVEMSDDETQEPTAPEVAPQDVPVIASQQVGSSHVPSRTQAAKTSVRTNSFFKRQWQHLCIWLRSPLRVSWHDAEIMMRTGEDQER
jgi:hypothetical protein